MQGEIQEATGPDLGRALKVIINILNFSWEQLESYHQLHNPIYAFNKFLWLVENKLYIKEDKVSGGWLESIVIARDGDDLEQKGITWWELEI